MAKRNEIYDYVDLPSKDGKSVTYTLTVKLYNTNDGSIYYMPHGGNPAKYAGRGYIFKPTPAWEKQHAEYLVLQAKSLKVSKHQRTMKDRQVQLDATEAALTIEKDMVDQEERIAKAEAEQQERIDAFNAKPNPITDTPAKKTKPKK